MSTENNNLFTDFEALNPTWASNAGNFSASEPLTGLSDAISPHFQGLIPEPTDALFDKMWESCDPLENTPNTASAGSLSGRTEFQPLSPDAFMSPSTVLEGRGSAPAFDDVFPERLRPVQLPTQQPEKTVPEEIRYFEHLWETGNFPQRPKSKEQVLWESELEKEDIKPLVEERPAPSDDERVVNRTSCAVEVPQLLAGKVHTQKKESRSSAEVKKTEKPIQTESAPQSVKSVQPKGKPNAVATADQSKSRGGWTLSLISGLTALVVGLFLFGWKMLPAYLVQYQIQQATGLSLKMKNVSQDYRAGMTSVESIQAFDSAQRPFFETDHVAFSSLPYYVGDNQQMKWAMVEGIRFAPTPAYVNPNGASLSNNQFNKALKAVGKELDESQIDLLAKNSVGAISAPYEKSIRAAEQEVKNILKQIQALQERVLASGKEATDADKAQATSYQQRMQMALKNMSIEESQYNQRNTALLNNLHSKREDSRAESNIPILPQNDVTEYLFAQDYTEFTGLFLHEIRQFCRWLPSDLEKTLGSVDKLDPASLSFRRIDTQEQLAVGQIRLTGQTQFMNQTVPFSAVITNYSTKPNGKPLTLDVAFGENQSARLRLEAYRSEERTELKVEFVSSNVNPGIQFGFEDGLHVKLEPDEKTPYIQTRSLQFIVSDGKIQGEYAMAQTAPSVSIGVSGVRSEANVAKLQDLIQSVGKITLKGTISGQFAKPEFCVSSNLESWGHTVLTIAANEYDQRMDSYRTAIEKKIEEAVESEQKRIAKLAEDVKVSANGNALLLNQLSSGIVDSQIAVDPEPSDITEDVLAEDSAMEVKEENPAAEAVADSEELTLPSLDGITAEEDVVSPISSEELPFPELPDSQPETAQPSGQIASGDVMLNELPSVEDDSADTSTFNAEELPALPDVDELLPPAIPEENTESAVDPQSAADLEFPPLEDLAPQNGVPMTAPTELNSAPANAMEISSPDANYQSPEMEFLDDAPMEEALPEEQIEPMEDAIPLVAPNTYSNVQRTAPPSLPVVIED